MLGQKELLDPEVNPIFWISITQQVHFEVSTNSESKDLKQGLHSKVGKSGTLFN